MASPLLRTKSPELLISEAEKPDRKMKRTLSALDLTALGIGAIIGAGIFSLIGTADAGENFYSRLKTALINFIIAAFSGNCFSRPSGERGRHSLFRCFWLPSRAPSRLSATPNWHR
jgi:hypothetical protein